MRNAVCRSLVDLYSTVPFMFLTGDLGFMALEPLQNVMGDHFINAGVAEQNMMSVAAGISGSGLQCWVYSIAPFLYSRPFEQIRNDVCLHDFDVKLIGNGGGYAYGSMGASHHALEDYGILLALQNMHVFIPAFAEDVSPVIAKMAVLHHPAYLRLGKCEKPDKFVLPPYKAWRKLLDGKGPLVLIVGPLAGGIINAFAQIPEQQRPEIWILSELPVKMDAVPDAFWKSLEHSGKLCIVEEHVQHGSVGQIIAHHILTQGLRPVHFEHVCALGYPSGYYGSQLFHRKECGLDPDSIVKRIAKMRLVND